MTPQSSSAGSAGNGLAQSVQQRWPNAAATNQIGVVGFGPKAFHEQRIQWALSVGLVIALLLLPAWIDGVLDWNSDGQPLALRATGGWSTTFVFSSRSQTPVSSAAKSRQKSDGTMEVAPAKFGPKTRHITWDAIIYRGWPEPPLPTRPSAGAISADSRSWRPIGDRGLGQSKASHDRRG